MKRLVIFIVLLLVAGYSCRKKEYPKSVVENEPVFYIKATINHVDYVYNAGLGNYRMYSSYGQDNNGVYNFIGHLRQKDCSGICPQSLKMQINDVKVSAINAPTDISAALTPKRYNLNMPSQEVKFSSQFNKNAHSYLWNFGDGESSTLANPTHIYKKQGNYQVSLTVKDTGGCISSIVNTHRIGYSNKLAYASIKQEIVFGTSIIFSAKLSAGTDSGNPLYLWNFGDGEISNLASPTHKYKYHGSYPVNLRVISPAGDTTYANYNAVTQADYSSCAANFSISSITSLQSAINQALSEVFITWVDENGLVFSSSLNTQPSSSYFEIVSVEDYEANENEDKTKKIKVKFKCDVFNGSRTMSIDKAEAVICVAYK